MQADPERVERTITAVKAGDRSGLHYLYVRYADELWSHARSIVGAHGDAEDLMQTVFLTLPRAIATYDSREPPFDRWLLRLAQAIADNADSFEDLPRKSQPAILNTKKSRPKLRLVASE